jgi:hypothetical protein
MTSTIKSAAAAVTTAITEAIAFVVPTKAKPTALTLIGPIHTVCHKMTASARLGYLVTGLNMYPATGQMSVTLEIGCPDPSLVEAVESDMAEALEVQDAQRLRDIELAAVQLVADREKAARKAEMDAKVAEAELALAALKAAAAV